MALFQETFPGHVISGRSDINWPPRSRNLTTLDFFCGTTRKTVFMQINLRQVRAEIPPNMCQKMVENHLNRINVLNTSRGDHLNDLVFHSYCQRSNFRIKRKYHEKKIFSMCFIYVYFCNHEMDNPIFVFGALVYHFTNTI